MKNAVVCGFVSVALLIGAFPSDSAQAKESKSTPKAEDKRLSSASLFPMALGSRWVYRVTDKQPGAEEEISASVSIVRGVYLLGEQVWYQYEEGDYSLWLRNDKQGQHEATILLDEDANAPKLDRQFLVFKSNPKAGQKWTYRADEEAEEPTQVECLGTDKQVKVPAGNFRCVVYRITEGEYASTLYFAPGWGLVKYSSKEIIDGEESTHTEELMKYFPAKKQIKAPIKRGEAKKTTGS
ncbi:MAG: hypothetical protein RH917_09615 [Lacipirellulaceae bacterium]